MTNDVTPAQLRAAALKRLEGPGQRYRRLQAELEKLKAEMRPLIDGAVRMEVSTKDIAAVSGISRNTLSVWFRREREAAEGSHRE